MMKKILPASLKPQIKDILDKYFALVKRFVPEQVVRPMVGIDIGHHTCKMAVIKPKGNGHELVQWGIQPILQGNAKQAVQDILKTLIEPAVSLTTAVSGKGTLVRFIDMPRMNQDDLKKSFALEADKYFPFPKEQIYTDCFILDKAEKDNKMAVLVAAAKKELVDQRMELFKEMECQPDVIVLDSLALANAIHVLGFHADTPEDGPDRAREAVAVLDIGEKISNLMIMVDRLPRFCRDIFIGGHDLTSSIGNGLGLDLTEAEKLKLQPKARTADLLKAADSVIMNLVSELRLSFDYFITEKNVPISRLLLTGGASMLPGLPAIFAKYLEMDVRPWDMMATLSRPPEIPPEEVADISGKLGVAVGLALYR